MKKSTIASSPVLNIFRNNSYKINFFHGVNYLIQCGEKFDFCTPSQSLVARRHISLMLKKYFFSIPVINNDAFKDGNQEVERSFMLQDFKNNLSFNYIHFFTPGHAASKTFPFGCNMTKEIDRYSKSARKTINTLKRFVEKIVNEDPNGVILVTSDHGALIYDKCNQSTESMKHYISRHNSLFLIRSKGIINTNNLPRHSVNFFPYVFNLISKEKLNYRDVDFNSCLLSWQTVFTKLDNQDPLKRWTTVKTSCKSIDQKKYRL